MKKKYNDDYLVSSDPKRCEDCCHLAHKGNCPYCSKGEICNPHPVNSTLPGWKKLV